MPLDRLTKRCLVRILCPGRMSGQHCECPKIYDSLYGIHSRTSRGSSGGPPSRQKISGSTTSS